jgi:hypothetical protein
MMLLSPVVLFRVQECRRPVGFSGVVKERRNAVGGVIAGSVMKERIKAVGHVAVAGVVSERIKAIGRVVVAAAAGKANDGATRRARYRSRRCARLALERIKTGGRVGVAACVLSERTITISCVIDAGCVALQRNTAVGRVVVPSCVAEERMGTGGRVVNAGGVLRLSSRAALAAVFVGDKRVRTNVMLALPVVLLHASAPVAVLSTPVGLE